MVIQFHISQIPILTQHLPLLWYPLLIIHAAANIAITTNVWILSRCVIKCKHACAPQRAGILQQDTVWEVKHKIWFQISYLFCYAPNIETLSTNLRKKVTFWIAGLSHFKKTGFLSVCCSLRQDSNWKWHWKCQVQQCSKWFFWDTLYRTYLTQQPYQRLNATVRQNYCKKKRW